MAATEKEQIPSLVCAPPGTSKRQNRPPLAGTDASKCTGKRAAAVSLNVQLWRVASGMLQYLVLDTVDGSGHILHPVFVWWEVLRIMVAPQSHVQSTY